MRRLVVAALMICAVTASYGDDETGNDRQAFHRERVRLQVFDAHGRRVGPLTSLAGSDGVLLNADGVPIFVAIERKISTTGTSATDFQWSAPALLSYATSDCSDGPFVRGDANQQQAARPSMAVRSGPDVIVYIAAEGFSAGIRNVSVQSAGHGCEALSYAPRNICEDYCVWLPSQGYVLPYMSQVWPVAGTYELTRRFPEPLRIGD